jgi:hypothetical protein
MLAVVIIHLLPKILMHCQVVMLRGETFALARFPFAPG